MRLLFGAATDVGQVRTLNEDGFVLASTYGVVADGMGGHQGGEVASALALEVFDAVFDRADLDAMVLAVEAANTAVFDRARGAVDLSGMGTTLCGVAELADNCLGIVNVGDSRIYLWDGVELTQLSEDHSFVEGLVRDGRITKAQAEVHPQRNVLTRALGVEPTVQVDGWLFIPKTGDRLLLCSDGLYNEVTDLEIGAKLAEPLDPTTCAGELVAAANAHGARDNVTCIVVDVAEGAEPASTVEFAGTSGMERLRRVVGESSADAFGGEELDDFTAPPPQPVSAPGPVSAVGPVARPTNEGEALTVAQAPAKPKGFNWRVLAFAIAIFATLGGALGAIGWYARNQVFVGAVDGEVVIYQGRPEGVLWIDPIVTPQSILLSDLFDESQRLAVESNFQQPTMEAAKEFVASLQLRTGVTEPGDTSVTPSSEASTTTAPSVTSEGNPAPSVPAEAPPAVAVPSATP